MGKILQILSFFKKVSVVRRFIVFSNSFNNVLPKTILNRPQKRGVLYMGNFGMRGGLVTSILFIKKSILKFISIVSSTVVHVFCFDCHSPFNSFIDHSPSHTYLWYLTTLILHHYSTSLYLSLFSQSRLLKLRGCI